MPKFQQIFHEILAFHILVIAVQTSYDVNNFNHITSLLKAEDGENGRNKGCHGKNADHQIVKVPVGTIVKNALGHVVGDLNGNGVMFVAARGGAGGKGNPFFVTDMEQAPQICEYGAQGEDLSYVIELRSMAHLGLVCIQFNDGILLVSRSF